MQFEKKCFFFGFLNWEKNDDNIYANFLGVNWIVVVFNDVTAFKMYREES